MQPTLLIFDDTCAMCTRSTRIVRAFDWLRRFRATGFSEARTTFPDLARADLEEGIRVRFPDGTYTVGIDAVRSVAMRTPLGALVGWTLYIPPVRAVGDRLYRFVASRRTRACRIPN